MNLQAISEETTIIKEIEKGKVKGTYSPQLRAFALTINFYSLIIISDKFSKINYRLHQQYVHGIAIRMGRLALLKKQ